MCMCMCVCVCVCVCVSFMCVYIFVCVCVCCVYTVIWSLNDTVLNVYIIILHFWVVSINRNLLQIPEIILKNTPTHLTKH